MRRRSFDIGDLVEINGRCYEVIPDTVGGLTLEAAVTVTAAELDRRHGTRPATEEEVESQLDLEIGDRVEIDGRRYDVVSDKAGGVALEPAITISSADLHERHGTKPISQERFAELFGDIPRDEEG